MITLVSSGLSAAEPPLHGAVFDRIVGPGRADVARVPWLLGPLGAVFVSRQALEGAATPLGGRVRLRVNHDLLAEATARMIEAWRRPLLPQILESIAPRAAVRASWAGVGTVVEVGNCPSPAHGRSTLDV